MDNCPVARLCPAGQERRSGRASLSQTSIPPTLAIDTEVVEPSHCKTIEALERVSLPDVIPLGSLTVESSSGMEVLQIRQLVDCVVSCWSLRHGVRAVAWPSAVCW
jgi:hypothetical protein